MGRDDDGDELGHTDRPQARRSSQDPGNAVLARLLEQVALGLPFLLDPEVDLLVQPARRFPR
jgi:hypothetical protein